MRNHARPIHAKKRVKRQRQYSAGPCVVARADRRVAGEGAQGDLQCAAGSARRAGRQAGTPRLQTWQGRWRRSRRKDTQKCHHAS